MHCENVLAIENYVSSVQKGLAPPRAELLTWFAILGRLNTKDKFVKFNMMQLKQA